MLTILTEWLKGSLAGHTFGKKSSYGTKNNNLVGRFSDDTVLEAPSGSLLIQAGTEFCIFRLPSNAGDEIVATIYLGKTIVNIYGDGRVSQKLVPSLIDTMT